MKKNDSNARNYGLIVTILVLITCLGSAVSVFALSDQRTEKNLIIPKISEVKENGYPLNANGESYGPAVKESAAPDPDLMLAENEQGLQGYIRASEVDEGLPSTPEEAAKYRPQESDVNLYLQDGVTVIGKFHITVGE